jgi:type IV pilus assembly protein PilB
MPKNDNISIGEMLVEQRIITVEQLAKGLEEEKKTGEFICTSLVKLGFASEENIFKALSAKLGIAYVKIKDIAIKPSIIQKIPVKFVNHYKIIPLELKDNALVIAMVDPLDVRTLDDIRLLLGLEVRGVLASESEIQEGIRKYYGVGAETLAGIISSSSVTDKSKLSSQKAEDLKEMAEDASIVKFVNQILMEAVRDRATDIHIEPFQDELRTRFRIDGVLYNINIPETIKYFHPAIVSRIKIMSYLNIAERRLPQDGRIKIKVNDQELDLRVSTLPTAYGEAVHLRILSLQSFLELQKIGLFPEDLKILEEVIKKPHGIIFLTGPTGSGKTTTLYAALAHINLTELKIITVEDPVEYQLRGVNQMQVAPKIGLSFATGLRHMLRHDPDVMMVGEVRDFETAEIAIRAALTGHLVFSTLHTNDAAGAITRLLDMGIEPFLLASSLECLIAQRLVRVICPKCRTQASLSPKILEAMQKYVKFDPSKQEIYEGKGCPECRFTGYHGRTAIHEILVIRESIREMILSHASSQQIKQKAVSQGMRTLRYSGLQKVLAGITTYAEVARVTQQEELAED